MLGESYKKLIWNSIDTMNEWILSKILGGKKIII